jgi:hypothetical protein
MGPRLAASLATVMALLLTAGCTNLGDDAGVDEATDPMPLPSVTVPPERLTSFCQAMIDLSDELETDPPADPTELILDTYLGIVDEVPAEIEDDFLAVIAALEAPPTPSTSDPTTTLGADPAEDFDAEGYLPDDEPNQRLNDYVQFACRDSQNNPGPPATQPLDRIVVDDTTPG